MSPRFFCWKSKFFKSKNLLAVATLIVTQILSPQWSVGADKIRIGYGAQTVYNAVLWIANEGKIFEKNSLSVESLYLESALVQRALIAREIQAGQMTGALMSAPRLQGADLVMIAGFVDRLTDRLVVHPDIRSAGDLKGKRVGVSRFGAVTDTATRLLLTKLGLNPEKDVILLQVGGTATRMAALIGGSVDATLVAPPDYKKAVEAGMRVLVNMEEIGIPYQHQSLVTTQSFIAKNPSIVQRMVKSFVEGIHLMRTNPELSKRTISKYMRVKEEKDLEEAYQLLRRLIPAKPYPSLEGFKTVLAGLAKEIPAAATANPRDFVDVRFLEELDRSGFIDGLYR